MYRQKKCGVRFLRLVGCARANKEVRFKNNISPTPLKLRGSGISYKAPTQYRLRVT